MFSWGTTKIFHTIFPTISKAHILATEYPQGIYSPIFVVEGFSGLSAHPSIFFNQRFKLSINNPWNFI